MASQSVLEGLNACFDHRGEIYVPRLGMTFKCSMRKPRFLAVKILLDRRRKEGLA